MDWEWFKVSENPPPENMDLLGCTSEGHYKVVRSCRGRFDTYLNIVWWTIPVAPALDEIMEEQPKKRRGRPRKA